MKRSTLAIFCVLFAVFTVSMLHAKRSAPEKVAPVADGVLDYHAPHSQMGFVEAWNVKNKQLIWRRQIYVVKYDADLERDVQDVFITSIQRTDKGLTVKNERGSEYELDLDTLTVKVVKGSLVEKSRK